ncbi:gliding motility-associated C-terminal domain-containing protein [Chitinophaga japonensis]|uniref:Gliding motility-associated-like protein n=1 Tax=Chitinophaga japonensis TaxID=104662 RepID=A0A562TCG8_CHIJA|nr:gliding motility-associated C-terminal domain-containing protein [Chitinophaga japonensis]TWI90690.1 gliding motility-associated-like protein [Chitinophaga japonensis]
MKSLIPAYLTALLPLFLLTALYSHPVKGQQANFVYNAPAGQCSPAVIELQNTSTGYPLSYTWDFGNGTVAYTANAQATYTQPGTYRVTLTVQYANGTSEAWKEITIQPSPAVAFDVDVAAACQPYTANFTDHTPGAAVRTWDFGDGSTPVTTNSATVMHSYTRAGQFDVTLTVTNAFNCTQALTKPALINITVPAITLSGTNITGCAPLDANLSATVSTINNDPVTRYNWSFGDGTSQSTATPDVAHRYNGTGAYDVTLTVTTGQGCSASLTAGQLVRAGSPPANVSFTATPGTACAGDPVRLLATATNADSYSWDFGDGTTEEGPDNDITHGFKDNGSITVQLRAGNNGCYTAATPVTVQITGPAAHFSFSRSCSNRNEFVFTNTSATTGGATYEWDFGDGSPLAYTRHTTHVYAQPGNYTVRLTVRETGGGACSSSEFQALSCFRADFNTGASAICRGSNIGYGVLHVPGQLVDHYSWRFGDNTVQNATSPDITKAYHQSGTFTDTLIIFYKDPATYCNDTVVKQQHITILAPVADFTTGLACAGQPVSITDASQPWPNIPLTNWDWNLGNGTTANVQTPAPPGYPAAGNYTIKLVVTDARNCKDSVTQTLTVNPTPFLAMPAPQYKICEGNSVTLTAQSDAAVQWSPNDHLSCVNCGATSASPVADTRYYATTVNTFGCAVQDSVDVNVVPQVRLAAGPDTAICNGTAVRLWASGAASYNWAPARYLSDSTIANPTATPAEDVTYTVTGSNDAACAAQTLQVTLRVNPLPEVEAGPDQTITTGSAVTLDATGSADVVAWEWAPTDYLDCPTCPYTLATVRRPISYSITATNAAGCTKSDIVHINLVCNKEAVFIPNTFSPNGDGANDIFYIRGKGVNFIQSFRIFNRWGQEVFKRENITIDDVSSGWNGTYRNEPQPADVYIYFIEAYCDTNERFELRGNVTLLR